MCSSLLGLGGTHVQQAFRSRRNICAAVFCVLLHSPPYLCAVFPNVQKQLNMSLLSYMSYQNHVGLQPANLVTSPTISCSRRVLYVFYRYSLQQPVQPPYFQTASLFHPVFRLFSTVYDRTTVRTSDVSYVPYEIFQNFKFNIPYCTYMFMHDFMPDFQYAL